MANTTTTPAPKVNHPWWDMYGGLQRLDNEKIRRSCCGTHTKLQKGKKPTPEEEEHYKNQRIEIIKKVIDRRKEEEQKSLFMPGGSHWSGPPLPIHKVCIHFHVIMSDPSECTDEHLQEQVNTLNANFRGINPRQDEWDRWPQKSDSGIEFTWKPENRTDKVFAQTVTVDKYPVFHSDGTVEYLPIMDDAEDGNPFPMQAHGCFIGSLEREMVVEQNHPSYTEDYDVTSVSPLVDSQQLLNIYIVDWHPMDGLLGYSYLPDIGRPQQAEKSSYAVFGRNSFVGSGNTKVSGTGPHTDDGVSTWYLPYSFADDVAYWPIYLRAHPEWIFIGGGGLTMTHEVGHFLGLSHNWGVKGMGGDDPLTCDDDDSIPHPGFGETGYEHLVQDTPLQAGPSDGFIVDRSATDEFGVLLTEKFAAAGYMLAGYPGVTEGAFLGFPQGASYFCGSYTHTSDAEDVLAGGATSEDKGLQFYKNSCGGVGDEPDQWENFMDYTGDRCGNLFTHDQCLTMRTVLENHPARKGLIEGCDGALVPPGEEQCSGNTCPIEQIVGDPDTWFAIGPNALDYDAKLDILWPQCEGGDDFGACLNPCEECCVVTIDGVEQPHQCCEFTFQCQGTAAIPQQTVWGDGNFYTTDSSLCLSALHKFGGDINDLTRAFTAKITTDSDDGILTGNTQNGVVGTDWLTCWRSFTLEELPPCTYSTSSSPPGCTTTTTTPDPTGGGNIVGTTLPPTITGANSDACACGQYFGPSLSAITWTTTAETGDPNAAGEWMALPAPYGWTVGSVASDCASQVSTQTLRFNIEDSANCNGTNSEIQKGTAIANITVPDDVQANLTIEFLGIGETEAEGFERIEFWVNGTEIGRGHAPGGNPNGSCEMGPVIAELPPFDGSALGQPPVQNLTTGSHELKIEFNTNDSLFHKDAYYVVNLTMEGVGTPIYSAIPGKEPCCLVAPYQAANEGQDNEGYSDLHTWHMNGDKVQLVIDEWCCAMPMDGNSCGNLNLPVCVSWLTNDGFATAINTTTCGWVTDKAEGDPNPAIPSGHSLVLNTLPENPPMGAKVTFCQGSCPCACMELEPCHAGEVTDLGLISCTSVLDEPPQLGAASTVWDPALGLGSGGCHTTGKGCKFKFKCDDCAAGPSIWGGPEFYPSDSSLCLSAKHKFGDTNTPWTDRIFYATITDDEDSGIVDASTSNGITSLFWGTCWRNYTLEEEGGGGPPPAGGGECNPAICPDLDLYVKAGDANVVYYGNLNQGNLTLNHDAHPNCANQPTPPEITDGAFTENKTFSAWYNQHTQCAPEFPEECITDTVTVKNTHATGDLTVTDPTGNITLIAPGGSHAFVGMMVNAGFNTGDQKDFANGGTFQITCGTEEQGCDGPCPCECCGADECVQGTAVTSLCNPPPCTAPMKIYVNDNSIFNCGDTVYGHGSQASSKAGCDFEEGAQEVHGPWEIMSAGDPGWDAAVGCKGNDAIGGDWILITAASAPIYPTGVYCICKVPPNFPCDSSLQANGCCPQATTTTTPPPTTTTTPAPGCMCLYHAVWKCDGSSSVAPDCDQGHWTLPPYPYGCTCQILNDLPDFTTVGAGAFTGDPSQGTHNQWVLYDTTCAVGPAAPGNTCPCANDSICEWVYVGCPPAPNGQVGDPCGDYCSFGFDNGVDGQCEMDGPSGLANGAPTAPFLPNGGSTPANTGCIPCDCCDEECDCPAG